MKDQELYNLIKKAVRERKQLPHHSQTQNFASRYCEHQLKKKFNPQNNKKMGLLMKDFYKLETYFNLPQLVHSIQHMNIKLPPQPTTTKPQKLQSEEPDDNFNEHSVNRHYPQLKNFKHSIQNETIKQLLSSLQHSNQWKSQTLKNNSIYHMNRIEDSISQQRDTHTSQDNNKVFGMLQNFLKNGNQRRSIQDFKIQYQLDKHPMPTSQQKKEITHFLHKVSSYLQIVLQNQYKSKWRKGKRKSELFKSSYSPPHTKSQHYKVRNKGERLKKDHSTTKCLLAIQQQTKLIKNRGNKYLLQQTLTQNIDPQQNKMDKAVNHSLFYHTSPTHQPQKENKPSSSLIKQNFTFRRRSIKQKIIKKLDKFIYQIDEETHCNRKENGYYNNQINKLQNHFKRLYGRYRKQTIAGEKDIQNLKMLAQEYTMLTPSQRPSNMTISDENVSTRHLIQPHT